MIINLRGTSGSGKSTLVRWIMLCYESRLPVRQQINGKDRKQPVGYLCHLEGGRSLYVLGHYESPCGGCDTLPTMDYVYDAVRKAAAEGFDVIYEGVIVTSDVRRCIQLHTDGLPLLVVGLDVPIEECVAGINNRRAARGDERPLDPTNTIAKLKTNQGGMRKLQAAGVDARWLGRDEALTAVQEALELQGR